MNTLYTDLASIYEMMYRTFINYDEEYRYYSHQLLKNNVQSVVELGCGTGNLAEKFITGGFKYTGADLSKSMLAIAAAKCPPGKFIETDMRNFVLPELQDGCFFAGRTSAYLVSDDDMPDALRSVNKNLKHHGVICFDCIDADKFIPLIKDGKQVVHTAAFEKRRFHRASYWTVVENQPGVFNWRSVYFEIDEQGTKKEIGCDDTTLRSFTKKEIEEMLRVAGFELLQLDDRPSYAFDTFVVTAKKTGYGNV
jgi:SAM-dependent methyltransferase